MRKQTILILSFIVLAFSVSAQGYNNEWINYKQTYYKFKVAVTGLYRINQSALQTAGIANTPAEQFQLWRNGKQIPIYTSISTGTLLGSDYIEFWGEKNDGKPDKALYSDSAFQLSDKISLQTDTAAYFLTINSSDITNNKRISNATNDIAANTLLPEPYFTHSERINFNDRINRGYASNVGQDLYSSAYDVGEIYSTKDIQLNSPYSFSIKSNLYFANNNNINLIAAIVGNAGLNTGPRTVNLLLNNNQILSKSFIDYNYEIDTVRSLSPSFFNNSGTENFNVTVTNTANQYDRIVLSFVELQYQRKFNFGGLSNFTFSLPAKANGYYLEITNFNWTSGTPVLYDLTNNKRYTANTATTGILKFALPASGNRNFVLVNEDASNISVVNNLVQKVFIDYSDVANQGDYLIISGKLIANSVNQYNAYRNSVAGGKYNSKVFDIDELVDQFAYGIKKHPLSIKNFIRYAIKTFATKPKYVFLIGKGVTYDQYNVNQTSPYADVLNMVPTFGWPASDVLLAASGNTPIPEIPIGRLSAINDQEVTDYLNKVIQYDNQATNTGQTINNKLWMKEIIHINGADANDIYLQQSIDGYEANWQRIIEGPVFGGHVNNFRKDNSGVTTLTNQRLTGLFNTGYSLLSYFGHSAASTLGYNLDDPSTYNNTGKYPIFLINGCDAGNFFDYDITRLTAKNALAEIWVFAPQKGAIGFIASTHFGLTNYLDSYTTGFYNSLASNGYNIGVGNNLLAGNLALQKLGFSDYYTRIHAEEILLHGDPAIKIYADSLPDYDVEDPQVVINPSFISVARTSFNYKAFIYNLGKVSTDSVNVLVTRKYPDGTSTTLFNQKLPAINYIDSVNLNVPVIATRDKGNNSITITVDNDSKVTELSELNNTITKQFVVYEDEITPVYPYNYAIVNKPVIKFTASTADALSTSRAYTIEVDTTELFNSPAKLTQTITTSGGIVDFTPTLLPVDSTVYYWRVAIVPSGTNTYRWNNSSFVYLANSPTMGYNQSHLYQHLKSADQLINLDSNSRRWSFSPDTAVVHITHSIFPYSGHGPSDFELKVNDMRIAANACVGHSIIFNLLDPKTMKPYYNYNLIPLSTTPQLSAYGSFMGSAPSCDATNPYGVEKDFEFNYMDTSGRRKIRDFLDWIPTGMIVSARLILDEPFGADPFVDVWKADQAVYGAGNTLYDKLKNAGLTDLDSFISSNPRTWAFIFKKNTPSFTPQFKFSKGINDQISFNVNIPYLGSKGYVTSPKFGPAKSWKKLKWFGSSLENAVADIDSITIVGIDTAGIEKSIITYSGPIGDIDISAINATNYPFLKLVLNNRDTSFGTPYQLKYWRLLADLVPEGALAPSMKYTFTASDTLSPGQPLNFGIAFKNISDMNYPDSISVKMQIIDNNNVTQDINLAKLKPIVAGDTTFISTNIDTKNLTGSNTIYLSVNPTNNPREQNLFNNYLYKRFFVQNDNIKPVLDITFDGVHILNGDMASAKPNIRIKLKDESKYFALDDTANIAIQLQYPDNSVHTFKYGTDTLKFIPANIANGVNEAVAEFNPALFADGNYQLIVQGKDKNNNASGSIHYSINFKVNNTPKISNVFNYPNPFTSSTAFVFTLTGSEVPSMLRIQILTITGKIIKEINKNELGPLHIGNNMTEYKWDGTDQYGDKVANGVYLYRVITNLHGNQLDKYSITDEANYEISTNQYFNSGYGKMYLMR